MEATRSKTPTLILLAAVQLMGVLDFAIVNVALLAYYSHRQHTLKRLAERQE